MEIALNLVLAVTLLSPGLGCTQNSSGLGFDFNGEAANVQRLTISAGGQAMERHPMAQTPVAIRQEWRVVTEIPWMSYAKQLTASLEPSYRCETRSETRTTCHRQLPGDVLHLELAAEHTGAGLQVRISLEMRPD